MPKETARQLELKVSGTRLKPTPVFNTYWRFAALRQDVYHARLRGTPRPWTKDPIIGSFKFTNAYRAADRGSQFLIRTVIYDDRVRLTPEDVFFRVLLYKLFNRVDTWRLLDDRVGPITATTFRFDRYDSILTQAQLAGRSIYSPAYIVPPPTGFGHRRKHQNHLSLLAAMIRDRVCGRIARARGMREAFEVLRSYPGFGDFLAYQLVTDLNYSELTDFAEDEFVAAGPGAVDGIRKSFERSADVSDADIISLVADVQEEQFALRGIRFNNLFGRRLQYIDCQNLFCEVDKYSRVAHPEYLGKSGRRRIKQRYTWTGPLPRPWFPPKWRINSRVAEELDGRSEGEWN